METPHAKQKYKLTNWPEYNQSLKRRGSIDVWLSEEAISMWHVADRVYDGTGAPKLYSDFAIITCHEMRQVYRLPLRQCQGFINSLFRIMGISLSCPDYTVLSKRLAELNIKIPKYQIKKDVPENTIHAIAIDSTGLKRFGRNEWHQEKYKLSSKASWRKLHIAVNKRHIIEACALTNRFHHDESQVKVLLAQIIDPIDQCTADGAYDKTPVYTALTDHSPQVDVVIPPQSNAVEKHEAHPMRNRNIAEIKQYGRMNWQQIREYGQRNSSELCIQRYKRILGDQMHAREENRQKQEAMIGSGVLNKMTSFGMPKSYKFA